MKKLIYKIIGAILGVGFLVFIILTAMAFRNNDATERQVIQKVSGELDVRFNPGWYFAGYLSKVTTYPNNVTIQVGPKDTWTEEADYHRLPNTGTFSEGDEAELGHTVKWDLPNTVDEMKELHTTYNGINNLMTTTLLPYQNETAIYSTQRMTSEQHYSGGKSQLKEYFQDQLRNGQVLLVTETKTQTLEDGSTKTYINVDEKMNEDGTFKRTISDIQKYKLYASFASIDHVKYDSRIYTKLKDKIDAAADEATSKQRLITAQQEEQEAIVKGRKLIAETTAREEAKEQEAVIQARKERLVAQENVLRDKAKAESLLALKKAEAEGDKLKVKAGLSPLEAATIAKEERIGIAKALALRPVPYIVNNGSGNSGDLTNSYSMQEMIVLIDKISNSKVGKNK